MYTCSFSLGAISRRVVLRGLVIAGFVTRATNAIGAGVLYPNRTIKLVVPLPPGAIADALPRILADKLSAKWGVPVVVENRSGAANNLGAHAVARADPDGYTLLATPQGPLVISQSFYPKLGFDPVAFVPVSIYATQPDVILANSKAPFSNLSELIKYAKANPTKLTYGSPGIGSSLQLLSEMLQATADIQLTHVPYQGMAHAMTDLLAGNIDLTVDPLANALPQVKEGNLKAIAVTSRSHVQELPGVASMSEIFPELVFMEWFAVVAPPATPPEIAAKLSEAITEALREPDVVQRFGDFSMTPLGTSPTEATTFLEQEAERWRKIIAFTRSRH